MAEEKNGNSRKTVFNVCWLIALFVGCMLAGMNIPVSSGNSVVFSKIVEMSISDIFVVLAEKCVGDIAAFVLISLTYSKIRILAASLVISWRSIAFGIASAFCAANSVPMVSVAMMMSYSMVSVMITIYAIVLEKCEDDKRVLFAVYFLVTGASVLLRILPLLFI